MRQSHKFSVFFLLALACFVVLSRQVSAAVPPTGSPMALGQHPRLFFSIPDLPGLRDRIATHYRTEFQDFINTLTAAPSLSSSQDPVWGAMNYAFLAALDPQQMQQRGFTFSAAFDSKQEYCDKAIAYAQPKLGSISAGSGQGHSDLNTGYPTNDYLPVLAVYDWCYTNLIDADKQAIVNAFVSAYNTNYKGKNLLGGAIHGYDMFANNQASADIFDILGILAFYGDPYLSSSLSTEMYDALDTFWMNRVLTEINYFYASGFGWHEGSGGYLNESFVNLALPVAMFSSALGTDYFSGTTHFTSYPLFAQANTRPIGLLSQCGASQTLRCNDYFDRWGTISGGYRELGARRLFLLLVS